MSTIGDLVNGNPFYDRGIFLNGSYYKEQIPQTSFQNKAPSPAEIRRAIIEQSCLTIASQVLLIGCVLIPSVYTLGVVTTLPAIGSALICALMTHDLDLHRGSNGEITLTGLISSVKFKGRLLAAVPKKEHFNYLLREAGVDTAIKVAFLGVVMFTPAGIASVAAHVGVFCATYHFTVELEKLLLLCIKSYAESQASKKLQQSGIGSASA